MCSNVVKFVRRKISEIVLVISGQKNKISPASQTVATARIAPKICQGHAAPNSGGWPKFHPNRFTLGVLIGFIAERMNTAKLPRRVNPIGGSIVSSRININCSLSV